MKYLFLFFLFISSNFAQLKYSTQANISSLTDEIGEHRMSVQGDNVYVCYKRGIGTSIEDREIKVSISSNKGLTWFEKDITIDNKNTFSPIITSTGSVLLILYKFIDINNQVKTCIARSTDHGLSFTLNSNDNENFSFVVNSVYCDIATTDDGKIFIGDDSGLFLSTDNGVTFNQINVPSNFSKAYRVSIDADNNNFWVTFNGNDSIYCYRSNNNGNNYNLLTKYYSDFSYGAISTCQKKNNLIILWNEEIVGINYLRIRTINGTNVGGITNVTSSSSSFSFLGLQLKQNNIWAFTYNKLFYSSDNGSNWSRGSNINAETNMGLGFYGNNFYCINDTTLFFLGEVSYSGSLKKYMFLNIQWADFPASELKNDTLFTNQSFSSILNPYVPTSKYRIEISNTSNFQEILIDTISNSNYFIINIKNLLVANHTKYYYRIRGEEKSYLTSWSPNKTFYYGNIITEIPNIIAPNNNFSSSWPDYVNFQWTNIPTADSYQIHLSSNSTFSDTIYFYGYPNTYLLVNDNQFLGAIMYTGDVFWQVRGYEKITGSYGSWSNIGKFHYSFPTAVQNENNNIPKEYILNNYPNPFNPTTYILYSIPVSQNIELNIFDLLGNQVTQLFNGYKRAGNYSVIFNASKLSSGIYFCRLIAGHFIQTKKLMLIK